MSSSKLSTTHIQVKIPLYLVVIGSRRANGEVIWRPGVNIQTTQEICLNYGLLPSWLFRIMDISITNPGMEINSLVWNQVKKTSSQVTKTTNNQITSSQDMEILSPWKLDKLQEFLNYRYIKMDCFADNRLQCPCTYNHCNRALQLYCAWFHADALQHAHLCNHLQIIGWSPS